MNKFMKVGVLGLAGCFIALGMLGTAFAADTSPKERAAQIAFEKSMKPYDSVTWTSEQFRAGAEYATLLNKEGPLPDNFKPYENVKWTSDQLRAGAEYAALLDGEGSLPDSQSDSRVERAHAAARQPISGLQGSRRGKRAYLLNRESMSHISIAEIVEGKSSGWGELVTDDQYSGK